MTDTPQKPLRGELAKAARRNDLKAAKDLLASGADVDDDFHGLLALNRAAKYGYTDMARLLIDNGAAINRGALVQAAYKGRVETAQLLIDRGADVDIRSNTGATALIISSQNDRNTEIVELLVNSGADINAQNDDGETALFKAASSGNRNMVRLLLDMGADPEIETKGGRTAADTRSHEVAEMVEEAIELKKKHAREAAAFAAAATAEKERHEAVASKQRSLRAQVPKFQLKAGP